MADDGAFTGCRCGNVELPPQPVERYRCLLAVILAVVAVAMNVAGGYLMKSWGLRTEGRLSAIESSIRTK